MTRHAIAFGLISSLVLHSAPTVQASERRVPDGARVSVRLMEQLSSATVRDHDAVNFAVLEDVVVDGEVVIKQGTPVRGVIVEAQSKRRMGRAGNLYYTVNETKSVDRAVIRLRAVQERKGDSNVTATAVTTGAVAVFVPVAAPFFLLRKGHDVVIPEGTRVEAFVDGDHLISTDTDGRPQAEPSPRRTGLTNADIVTLLNAGFGDEVLLAKIGASSTAFTLDAADLMALKKAGVSDRVVAAMVAAK